MAKGMSAPEPPKMKPRVSVSWQAKDGMKLEGDTPAMGQRCRMIVEGKCSGFSLQEYGNSIELEAKSVRVESLGMAEDGESLVDLMESQNPKKRKKE